MIKKVHFLGIGGSGASAAAAIAQAYGFKVTCCDLEPHNEFTTVFRKDQLLKGHTPAHLQGVLGRHISMINILAVTPAIFSLDPDNPELMEAKKLGIPVLTWQQFVGEYLTKNKFVIAVCGTHGKTTTTAMIAQILEDAGEDPIVLLGAIHPKWKTNYRLGKSKPVLSDGGVEGYLVIEADEFNDNFLHFKPDISVVTNIEMDHPEYFKDFESYKKSFKKFLLQSKSTVVANLSDNNVAKVVKVAMKTPNQISSDRGANVQYLDFNKLEVKFDLKIPGKHNILNAKAAFQVGLLLGIAPEILLHSLNSYSGVGRRFELIGIYHGAQIYSDFGHHPTEIKVTMKAARQRFPRSRIILVYEPHMFSRTKALFDDFVKVFKNLPVDQIILTDIYPSREIDTGLVSSQQLADAAHSNALVYHSKDQLLPMLKHHIQSGDIIFFMGAGEIDKLARELLS